MNGDDGERRDIFLGFFIVKTSGEEMLINFLESAHQFTSKTTSISFTSLNFQDLEELTGFTCRGIVSSFLFF